MSVPLQLAVFFALLATGGYWDLVRRRLPNLLCLGTFAAGIIGAIWAGQVVLLPSMGAHCVLALLVGIVLFRFGMLGGGDVKFYAATAIWFPLASALRLLFSVSLFGIVLLIVWVAYRQLGRRFGWTQAGLSADGVPYGIAIALGGIACKLWDLNSHVSGV